VQLPTGVNKIEYSINEMDQVLLFDLDGTLTEPMQCITEDMVAILQKLRDNGFCLNVVGGSDYPKIKRQLGNYLHLFYYICSENGLATYLCDKLVEHNSLRAKLGEEVLQEVINAILHALSTISIPVKCGNFIELRNSALNVSPIGRACSESERREFNAYDREHNVREGLIECLKPILNKYDLEAVIGGMISIDIYPKGWDKCYCLKYFEQEEKVSFFGDKTEKGGNDYTIYNHPFTNGFKVESPSHLIDILEEELDKFLS
jgi:phosphomannomutase